MSKYTEKITEGFWPKGTRVYGQGLLVEILEDKKYHHETFKGKVIERVHRLLNFPVGMVDDFLVEPFLASPKKLVTGIECFEEVAEVIGRKAAMLELFKVSQSTAIEDVPRFRSGNTKLVLQFYWRRTPQGYDFWEQINEQIKKNKGV